uniref:Aldehyde oxidase 5 n=1 Tax=Sinocyclocheilus anshuiensis TaxID=1608454 RepID=A0A671SQ22_9TELE
MSSLSVNSELVFYINGKKIVEKNADPEEMLLAYLHWSVNACLQPICSLHGAAVVTIEGIGSTKTKLHPVQEHIAKAHGSQCWFCTPGMVMSMYTLLRNNPQPTMEDIRETLGGNLCRCTGYRPIIDGFKTFCDTRISCQNGDGNGKCCMENSNSHNYESDISGELFSMDEVLPLDPTQDLIFPPELLIMRKQKAEQLCFQGEKVRWISPADLKDLIKLKAEYSNAPLLVGNTTIGPKMNLKGTVHPLVIYGGSIPELQAVKWRNNGVTVGAGCSLSVLKDILLRGTEELGPEKSRVYQALVQTLQCLAGKQIRNMASIGGNILSANPKYDLSSILAAAECTLHIVSNANANGAREICLSEEFFTDCGKTALRPDEILLAIDIAHSRPWEFVSAFRQSQRREFAFSIVNAGMRVVFRHNSNVVENLDIFYGGVGPTLVKARHTCKELMGRKWDEKLLVEGTQFLEEEMYYRKTLVLRFFFKFYMQVLLEIQQKEVGMNDLPLEYLSALKPFKNEVPQGNRSFQLVPETQSSSDPVGRPNVHQAALQQVTGEAVYYDDIPSVKGELFVSMVTSTRSNSVYFSQPNYTFPKLNTNTRQRINNPHAIYSSKGIGEPSVFFGCTLFFAIKEAIAAARRERGLSDSFPFSSPATAEKIRIACEDCFTRMIPLDRKVKTKPWTINV